MAKKKKKETKPESEDTILYAIIESPEYNQTKGFSQPLLFITYKEDWAKGECSDAFDDNVYSDLYAFSLSEFVEGVFEPMGDPMNTIDIDRIAKSLGFEHDQGFEDKVKSFNLG